MQREDGSVEILEGSAAANWDDDSSPTSSFEVFFPCTLYPVSCNQRQETDV